MNQSEREALAAQRAEQYAPHPTGGAMMAGVCGATVTLLGDVSLSKFYGWGLLSHPLLSGMAVALGFLFVLLGYLRAQRLSRKARRHELSKIDLDETGSAGRAVG
jgi:hypothetical protein